MAALTAVAVAVAETAVAAAVTAAVAVVATAAVAAAATAGGAGAAAMAAAAAAAVAVAAAATERGRLHDAVLSGAKAGRTAECVKLAGHQGQGGLQGRPWVPPFVKLSLGGGEGPYGAIFSRFFSDFSNNVTLMFIMVFSHPPAAQSDLFLNVPQGALAVRFTLPAPRAAPPRSGGRRRRLWGPRWP